MSNERTRLLSGQSSTYTSTFEDIEPQQQERTKPAVGIPTRQTLKTTSHLLFWVQAVLVVLFAIFPKEQYIDNAAFLNIYQLFTGVEIMVLVGFGYLRTFLKRYGMGALGFTIFIVAIGLQWGILTEAFFTQVYAHTYGYIPISIVTLVSALDLVTALLIAFGAVIGRVSPLQLVLMVLLQCVFYSINKSMLLVGWLDFIDAGGSIQIHMFGAYFGLAVAYILGRPENTHTATEYTAHDNQQTDPLTMIGTLFTFIYFPSFNARALEANSHAQQRAIIGTVLALCASTIGAFFASSFLNTKSRKFRIVDIQNATLAGGVAIGTVCNMTLSMGDCLLIGFVAGIVSCAGYNRFRLSFDACGVHNLHALPALIGALASVVLCYVKAQLNHDMPAVFAHSNQATIQLYATGITILVSTASGVFTGLLLGVLEPSSDTELYCDSVYWESDTCDEDDDSVRNINYKTDLGVNGGSYRSR